MKLFSYSLRYVNWAHCDVDEARNKWNLDWREHMKLTLRSHFSIIRLRSVNGIFKPKGLSPAELERMPYTEWTWITEDDYRGLHQQPPVVVL